MTEKKLSTSAVNLMFIVLCVLCGSLCAQDFKTVHDGVEYAEVTRKLGEESVKINLLRLDLTKVRLDVHHAMDAAIGTEKTSSIASRHGAAAAINAGFFRLDTSIFAGDAAGVLMIDGKLLSESSNNRSSIGILNHSDRTEINFGQLQTSSFVGFGTDSVFSFDGIDRERKPSEIILFTPDFRQNTLTDSHGTEIVLTNCKIEELRWWCLNAQINQNQGGSSIPRDGLVISIGKAAIEKSNNILYFAERARTEAGDFEHTFRVIRKVEGLEPPSRAFFSKAEDITNGVPQLIKNGKIDITWEQEKASRSFVETRHPRTAVAKLKDGRFLMITVDGRQPGVSVGMDLYELADYLLSLGAVDAMNLDGGGSTTMVLDGKVVNKPSDKEGERKVGDAILVTLRNKKSPAKNPKK
jgi:exopolysaccharide biosynthesis protein